MRAPLRATIVAACVACGLAAPNVRAETPADALYNEGKKLMNEGKYAEACPKFAESLRLDLGIGTMLWLAECYEKTGRVASAHREFKDAAELAKQRSDKRESVARDRANALAPRVAKIVVQVPTASDILGLVVRLDGANLGRAAWGTEIAVDPGDHVVAASAPNRTPWETKVLASQTGGILQTTVPVLEVPKTEEKIAPPPPPKPDGRGNAKTQRTLAYVAGGVGVVGLGIGTFFGFSAKSSLDDSNADNHCRPNNHCDAVGLGLRSDASSAALISTIGFAVGIAGLAGGAILYFTAPKDPAAPTVGIAPAVGPGGTGLSLRGAF